MTSKRPNWENRYDLRVPLILKPSEASPQRIRNHRGRLTEGVMLQHCRDTWQVRRPEGTCLGSDGTWINPTLRPQTLTLLRTHEARRSGAKVCEILMRYISFEFIFIYCTRSGAGITSDIFLQAFGDILFDSFFIRNSTVSTDSYWRIDSEQESSRTRTRVSFSTNI